MSFFDDKQEILKVELTTYGRYLMSRGKFKPVYYAFFDDDIIYDSEYASLEETQNSVQTRILDESISIKPQTTFTSIEDSVKLNTLLSKEIGKLKEEEAQNTSDKNYALSLPLGKSSNNSDYLPSWSLQFLNGDIKNVEYVINNSEGDKDVLQPFIRHPQIDLKERVYNIDLKNDSSLESGYKNIAVYKKPVAIGDMNGQPRITEESYYYSMKDEPIIIDLKENNVDDLLKNFDVEVYIETEETQNDGSINKIFKQLNMKKDPVSILNGILLDEPMLFDIQEDETFVEHYFELTFDDEIDLPPQQRIQLTGSITSNNGPFGNDC